MSSQAVISVGAYVLGSQVSVAFSRDDDGAGQWSQAPAVAGTGQLTTRTNTTIGVLTMVALHGLVTGKIDVFWAAGRRYNVDAVVTVDSIAISGGLGDNLPGNLTAITADQQIVLNAAFDPDDVSVMLITATKRASIVLADAGGNTMLALDLAASECCLWWENSGINRPFIGAAIAEIWVTNGDAAEANAISVSVLYDATP